MIRITDYKELMTAAAMQTFATMQRPNDNFHFGYVEDFNKIKQDSKAQATIIVQYPERWPLLDVGDMDGGIIRQRVFMGTRLYSEAVKNIDEMQQMATEFIKAIGDVSGLDIAATVAAKYPLDITLYPAGYLVDSDAVISFELNLKIWQCRV